MINIPHLIKYKHKLAALCLLLISFCTHAIQLAPLNGAEYVGDLADLEKKRVLRVLVAADLGFYRRWYYQRYYCRLIATF